MSDKARMKLSGQLGNYLMGHSPVDRSLLRTLDMTTDQWVALVDGTTTDEEVMAKLRERGVDIEKLHVWSSKFETRFKTFIPLWDLDEGYISPTPAQKLGLALFKPIEGFAMELLRRRRPAP